MQTEFTEEQNLLRQGAARFVERQYQFEARTRLAATPQGFSEEHWRRFGDLGWLAMGLSEEFGGVGGSMVDVIVVAEELGRGLVQEPFVACGVLGARALAACGTYDQRREWLPSLASGERRLALAHSETAGPESVRTVARPIANGYVLNGHKSVVQGLPAAHGVLVTARIEGADRLSLFLVDLDAENIEIKRYRTIDQAPAGDLGLLNVQVPASALVGQASAADAPLVQAWDDSVIASCAQAVGAMDRALWITRDYLKAREQFGVTLSTFQALQHRMAEMFIELEQSRSMLYRGVSALSAPARDRRRMIAAVKAYISQAAKFVGGQTIQLHGGIGITDEYIISHYYKRLIVFAGLFGDAEHHLEAFAADL